MSYTRDYIFEKIIEKLPTLKIHEKKEDDSSIFILEYKNNKAKIDIDSFVKKLGNKKNSLSDKKIDEFIYYIVSNFEAQEKISTSNLNKEDLLEHVFPVVRSTSFNKDNTQNLIKLNHTNETDIYLVYDFGNGYKFLDRKVTEQLLISDKELFDFAKGNLEKLSLKYNKDSVQGNDFYFLNAKDGYDGARILDEKVLNYFYEKIGSDFYVGLPHQDTLIIADVKNKKGLEILQKVMVHLNIFNVENLKLQGEGSIELTDEQKEVLEKRLEKNGIKIDLEGNNDDYFVVGEVLTCEKHPDADKLKVTTVKVSEDEVLQIVCGAPNVEAGQKVVVSLIGAMMPSGLLIKKSKLRGVESNGMLCSKRELGLPQEEVRGILVLENDVEVGTKFKDLNLK